jgi:integrase
MSTQRTIIIENGAGPVRNAVIPVQPGGTILEGFCGTGKSITLEAIALGLGAKEKGRDELVLWKGTLLDGHNRHTICIRRRIACKTRSIELKDRTAALLWIIDNQKGRRNVSDIDRIALQIKRAEIEAGAAAAKQRTGKGDDGSGGRGKKKTLAQNCAKVSARDKKTSVKAAKAAGVGERTFDAGKLILDAAAKGEIKQELVEDVRRGRAAIHRVAKDIKETRQKQARKQKRLEVVETAPEGTLRNGTFHRAVAESENSLARFVIRMAGKGGYRQKSVYQLTPSQAAAIPPTIGPDPFLWHRLPARADHCPICGFPTEGNRAMEIYHRAIEQDKNIPFQFVISTSPHDGPYTPLYPITAEKVSPLGSPIVAIELPSGPGDAAIALMARAAMLHVTGKTPAETRAAMNLDKYTVATLISQWPEHWDTACRSAKSQILKTVRAQIGTAAILDDVDGYLELAEAGERIATDVGLALLPKPEKPTLCTFFESFIVPNCLYDAAPITMTSYRCSLKLWKLITGDPALDSITVPTLTLFRDALSKRRGKHPGTYSSAVTVKGRLRDVQMFLDKAGPPARRNRDAQGLIANPPWIRPPRTEIKLPRFVAPEVFKLVYDATAGMDLPLVPGIKAPAWWKALLVVTFNTQLRRRTLFEMRMDEIDWQGCCLRLPAGRLKARRPMIVHLNTPAMQALQGIRTTRELIFPLPVFECQFCRWFHDLQYMAGIPKDKHFGLHDIRRTAATVLAGFSPQAAQLALGHTSLSTTMSHYINPTAIIGAALDAMPQPFA